MKGRRMPGGNSSKEVPTAIVTSTEETAIEAEMRVPMAMQDE
jgi:hypothetical protein